MKKLPLLLLLIGVAKAQVIDDIKYIWQPGFSLSPELRILNNYVYTITNTDFAPQYASSDSGVYSVSAKNVNELKLNNVAYGAKFDWNNILFRQWFNTASVSFQFMQPTFGDAMTKFIDKTYEGTVSNTDKAAASFHLRMQDVILHANHSFGSVLPYAGFGFDYYKVGGHLAYTAGSKRSTQLLYLPIGSLFQMSPMISGKMQVNILLSGKTKYAFFQDKRSSKTENNVITYSYQFSYKDATSVDHDTKTSVGFEGSLFIRVPGFGTGTNIEPYIEVWHLDKKDDAKAFKVRWRSFGVRANMSF